MTGSLAAGPLITLVRRGDRPACVMLPGAGGGLHPYMRLAGVLGATHNVYAVRAVGLLPDEEPALDIASMAAIAFDALRAEGIEPDVVFGWSLGGAVAWDLCVRLAAAGAGPLPRLALVDASPFPRRSDAGTDGRLRDTILGLLGPRPDPATADRLRRVIDAQITALAGYRARGHYPGRVLALGCTDDHFPEREQALARWAELAPGTRSGRLDAGHYTVFDPDALPQLVDRLTAFVTEPAGTR
jgi:thioesterase domain-containing protein